MTTVIKVLLNTLRNKNALESRVNAGEKHFHNVFEALNDAHSNYIAAKEEEDIDPQDGEYMNGPLQERLDIEERRENGTRPDKMSGITPLALKERENSKQNMIIEYKKRISSEPRI